MALTNIQRARIILDLLKDGDVLNQAAYANVDQLAAANALRYVTALYHRSPLPDTPAPTNEQLAGGFLRAIRKHIANAVTQDSVTTAVKPYLQSAESPRWQ